MAVISTMDTTYDNFFESPLIAPEVAMAADTPQIDTALEIIIVSSSSTFSLRHSQNAKYQTESTTMSDCNSPSEPALRISEKITFVPSNTKPIFTSNSAFSDLRNQSGKRNRLPTSKPISRLKITASSPRSFKNRFPASRSAPIVNKNTNGNPRSWAFAELPVNTAPRATKA